MKKYIYLFVIALLVVSCGVSNDFSKRKYLNLKHKTTKNKEEQTKVETNFEEESDIVYTEEYEEKEEYQNFPIEEEQRNLQEEKLFSESKEAYGEKTEPSFSYEKSNLERGAETEPEDEEEIEKEENIFGLIAFIFLCCSIFFPFGIIVSLILGLIGMSEINKDPDRYKNAWMAKVSVWVSAILILLFIALITMLIVITLL